MPSYRNPTLYERPPLERRAAGLALALAINLLLLLALLTIGVFRPEPKPPSQPLTVDLLPEAALAAAARPKAAEIATPPERVLPVRPPPAVRLPVEPVIEAVTEPAVEPERPLQMIELTSEEFAAADIGKMPKADPGSGRSGNSEVVGQGPNGETLYNAEWARRPTAAELAGYLPKNAPDGWGLVACKTIPKNRVEGCIEIASHPRGSKLSRAVRQAAWQFRVRPPRKNGRELIGEWVRIRIEYYRSD